MRCEQTRDYESYSTTTVVFIPQGKASWIAPVTAYSSSSSIVYCSPSCSFLHMRSVTSFPLSHDARTRRESSTTSPVMG